MSCASFASGSRPSSRRFLSALSVLLLQTSIAHAAPPKAPLGVPPKSSSATSAAPTPSAPPPERDAMKSAARELFDKGSKAMDENRWEDCRAALLAAWAIHTSYQIAGNLAECEVKLERHADAAEHLRFFLREMPASAPAERKARGEELLREVRPKIAELSLRVNKPDAEIVVDGKSVGRSPLATPVYVGRGEHAVEARLGGAVAKAAVSAKGGGAHDVVLAFEEAAPTPRSMVPAYVFGGVAIVGAAVGAGLLIASRGQYDATQKIADDILTHKKSCVEGAANYDARCAGVASDGRSLNALRDAGVASLIVAGAAAAGATIYALWPTTRPATSAVQVMPLATDTVAGLTLSGRF